MTVNRREFNKQETVRHIRSVFMSMYAKGGINGITINSLCKECGIAKSTFYLYYEDKYQVLESIENEHLDALRNICREMNFPDMSDVREGKPSEWAVAVVNYLKDHADDFRALLGKNGDPRFTYKWEKNIVGNFMFCFHAEKGDSRNATIACNIFSSSLIRLYKHLLFEMPDISARDFSVIIGSVLKFTLFDFQAFADGTDTRY